MKKLLLLDAYALIYRAYYAFIRAPRINSKGLNTSAILGFVNTLEDILKRENPTHIAVAFDPAGPTFRHEAYPEYKAQRDATPEDIKLAVPIIKDIIKAYNIPILEVMGFEADDVIGTYAKIAEQNGFQTYMVTPDKDYGQLVSENIFMYRPRHTGGYEIMGIDEVLAKYTLQNQAQVIDLLGLMGDSSDNIPGCPGVGEKTAIKLLTEFGSIENLLDNTDKLKGALQKKVIENKDKIVFSKFLATIKIDVPVEFNEDELIRKDADNAALVALFQDLEFRRLIDKFAIGNALQNVSSSAAVRLKKKVAGNEGMMGLFGDEWGEAAVDSGQLTVDRAEGDLIENGKLKNENEGVVDAVGFRALGDVDVDYRLVDVEGLDAFVEKLNAQDEFCFDTETTDVDAMVAQLVGMSFCWAKNEAYYISVDDVNRAEVLAKLKPIFDKEHISIIGQNLKYDLLIMANNGIEIKANNMFDTMIAHYLLQPELRHGMDYMAEIYLNYKTIHYEDLVGKGKKQLKINEVEIEKVVDYACEDADITLQLKAILETEIKQNKLDNLFYNIEMPLMKVLVKMELSGVRIDSNALKESSLLLSQDMAKIESEVQAMAGQEFNLSSAKQVGEILFDKLKIVEKAKKTKTGQYSTSEEVLEGLRSKHEIVGRILEYRGIKKLLSTYIDALPALVNEKTGKIHTSYNQTVTATGRLSSSNPNLQNIPIRQEMGKEIRKAFIPDEGCVFFSADYSQVELRIMAHLSEDQNMLDAFNSNEDIHAATAAKIYHLPIAEVTSDMRRKAKTANFGIIYGISVFGLSERIGCSRAEAKELIEGYFKTYPAISSYMDDAKTSAKDKGYVETLFGRKRYLADINSANSFVRAFAERNAINAPIQGSAADIIKIAMIRICERFAAEGIKSQMILQVHDELNFNVYENELEKVKEIVCAEMQNAVSLKVPLIADCGEGYNWLEAH